MRKAPSSTTTTNHQPTLATPVDDRAPPAGALTVKTSSATPTMATSDVQEGKARAGHSAEDVYPYNPSPRLRKSASWQSDSSARNYITPDIVAKVTGRARYAEDFRADGMLFCKLLLSPSVRTRACGASTPARALALPGVRAILTADDVPELGGTDRALPDQRAAVRGRADPGRGRGRARRSPPRRSS